MKIDIIGATKGERVGPAWHGQGIWQCGPCLFGPRASSVALPSLLSLGPSKRLAPAKFKVTGTPFGFSALKPNSGIRADLYIDFIIVTYLFSSTHVCNIVGLQAARDRPYAYSYARLVPQLTYDLHRTSGLAGASFSSLVDMVFAMEGP
jgi:hypothetical protein